MKHILSVIKILLEDTFLNLYKTYRWIRAAVAGNHLLILGVILIAYLISTGMISSSLKELFIR
ncbi:hypothetical protein CBW18_15930 [Pedobacter sp. AJM]|jgi:hypothetical protein|nr:hypothetical protein CBW18_15930 [Pedobacter sp. AJM]